MTFGSGMSNQVGIAQQNNYTTFVSPTRFHEFISEDFQPGYQTRHTASVAEQFERTGRDRDSFIGGTGRLELEVMNKGMGIIFKHAFGAHAIAQVGSTDEYEQTLTPGTNGGAGLGLSVQVGLAQIDGTVKPFNFVGGKALDWELQQALDANLKFRTNWDFHSTQEVTGLGEASYPDLLTPLAFEDAAISLAGGSICVRALTIRGARALNTQRRCLGNTKREPIANGKYVVSGEFDLEFESMDAYDAWKAGTLAEFVATWAWGEIEETGNPYKFELTIPEIKYNGSRPKSNGSDLNMQNIPFVARFNGDDPLFTAIYSSSDTAI